MIHNSWVLAEHILIGQANFLPAGCLSPLDPCVVTLFDFNSKGGLNMWTAHAHEEYNRTVGAGWDRYFFGTALFE